MSPAKKNPRKTDDPKATLAELGAESLAAELLALAEWHPEVEQRVKLLLNSKNPAGLAKEIRRRITALKRGSRFIHYRESFALAKKMGAIVDAIESELLPSDPARALELADVFLKTDAKIYGRLDDSSGSVADTYRAAGIVWLTAAKASGGKEDWVQRLHELVADDDYAVRETMIDNSAILLSEHELRRLARRYEKSAEAAEPDEDGYPWERHKALTKMGQVGNALKDVGLIERSLRFRNQELNRGQLMDLAQKELDFGRPRRAIERLSKLDHCDGLDYWSLMEACRRALGETDGLLDALWQVFSHTFSLDTYREILDLVPEKERGPSSERAAELVRKKAGLPKLATFFLETDPDEAEAQVLARAEEMQDVFYEFLRSLAERAESAHKPRIEVVCYRCLLLDILNAARSTAYGHAAKYLAKLNLLDTEIDDYGPLPDHQAFFSELKTQHARKSAFWRRIPQ